MAGDVVERQKKGGKKGLRRPKRRISIRIDMTPMVDIAFLLLIFYMVSTVFSMPQAMEINLPPDDQTEEIEVKESNLLTIRIDEESRFWWNLKTPTPENLPLMLPSNPNKPDSIVYKLNPDTLQGLLLEQNRANDKLNTLILIHKDATYADMVDILDEVDLIERSWNKYTADQLGKKVDELTKDEKFSYRYAIGDWNPRDDKILEAALANVMAAGGGE
ncbi:MAG: biopolymer transporter ExbD [candidate division Zixibacteria bacterium]|nr:biopolymer transporter ExbD [candidate division Zixibacteria bacterium]